MRNQLTITLAAVLAVCSLGFSQTGNTKNTPAQGTREETIIAREQAIWEAVKNKAVVEFGNFLAAGYVAVYSEGVRTKSAEVNGVSKTDLKDFSLTDAKVSFPQKNTVVITYKITVRGSYQGQDFSGVYYASSVWVKRSNKWQGVLHTEAKA
jgi:hypothetical protein